MKFNTSQFEFSHSRKPKGFGVWGFEVRRRVEGARGWVNETQVVFTPRAMNFTEAKNWVKKIQGGRDVVEFVVCP